MKKLLSGSQADFLTGLAVVLPVGVSFALVIWLFGTVSAMTDALLFFLPRQWTHADAGVGGVRWYWSAAALGMTLLLLVGIGRLARYYAGRKLIELLDLVLSKVPLLNKIHGTLKQVNEAFTSSSRGSFKKVVLVEYPHPGSYSIGFVTSEEVRGVCPELEADTVAVFVPTTPNPTSGFLLMVPEHRLKPMAMTVSEGVKMLISLGAVTPGHEVRAGGVVIRSQS